MFRRMFCSLVFLLLVPLADTRAATLTLETSVEYEGGSPTMQFGTAPASGHFGVLGLRLDDWDVDPQILGTVMFSAGPLLSLDVVHWESHDSATYRYAPGAFTMAAEWFDGHGVVRRGQFVAPLLALTIQTCEACDVEDTSYGFFTAELGPGRFDSALAGAIGVRSRSGGGTFSGDLDIITGDVSSEERRAGAPGNWDAAVEVTLPEPALTGLLAVGALMGWLSGRRRVS